MGEPDRIFFHAARLLDFKAELAVVVAFLLVVVLAPLLLVSPHLGLARRLLNGDIRTLWVQLHFLGRRRLIAQRTRATDVIT